ncbi:EAL domain-containing protein (putative c-di-GMP-specific phosphodiesterase class I) [Natronospira proteinivora]|uniref:EAL domain-containing protein (Putative c-di-GMP-specific phosphodiesterase class I) n=1 Tax=Natronospira proteinivora TaxID=1807133 RepID=A0ABT1G9M7_9GAMM|nr:EAL domain-containing protein [Natronospira proteinivora]MCP1728010.1 EAL domain-containing protein (putative c-di-GMP-specific phosphodiesterase class I) [Natronospira proteinivora]
MVQKGACPACEVVPKGPSGKGNLYVSPPVPHTRKKIMVAAKAASLSMDESMPGVLGIHLDARQLDDLLRHLNGTLSRPEREECNALFLNEGEELTLSGLLQARPLAVMTARMEGEWLVQLMEDDQLFAHFHPIVEMNDPDRVFAHECLLRARDDKGGLISPAKIFAAANEADLMFHLDRAARLTAIRDAVRYDLAGKIFINFNPTAIYDPAFCLQTTVRATQDAGIDPSRLVFEVIESEEVRDVDHLTSILDFYRKAGFGVALDDLGSGYASLNLLSSLRPDYVKFDRELVRDIDINPYKQKVFIKLAEMAQDLGVLTVAEGIESETEWAFLQAHNVDFAQGFLFCKPDAPPQKPYNPAS